MNDIRVGRGLRALRLRKSWRQADVALAAGVAQSVVSRAERGQLDAISVPATRRIAAALGATVEFELRWRGGDLDRMIDARHAGLVAAVSAVLAKQRWQVLQEVTYSEWGERGSIDVVGLLAGQRIALAVEVKGDVTSWEAAQRAFDAKVRLLAKVVADRAGWRPTTIGRIFVVDDTMTNRRRIAALGPAVRQAYPASAREIRRWMAAPGGGIAGLWFLSAPAAQRLGMRRVRRKAA